MANDPREETGVQGRHDRAHDTRHNEAVVSPEDATEYRDGAHEQRMPGGCTNVKSLYGRTPETQ